MPAARDSETPHLADRLGYVFVKAAWKVRQFYAEKLSEVGLLPNQHAILSTLNELGPCHQKALAARVVLDPGDIVAYLDSLQKARYVERNRDPEDRRRQIVSITDEGRALLVEADRALDDVEAAVFGALTPERRALLAEATAAISALEAPTGCRD
ncbi:MarR family transcriptional regulator [Prescottella agglutinans]|uniref:MarR family transcriptional regulator n=1 Tax=Prescottella agglutinans TaxID=1644129 RepID=A0A3S3AJ41_9NOCA|nr:MarR family winged helix-turn-helix transcriptional regulator [Prescottella agglutinans]RVW09426.1 MarR family transcriptional regulator [Prescottella agglutinans]